MRENAPAPLYVRPKPYEADANDPGRSTLPRRTRVHPEGPRSTTRSDSRGSTAQGQRRHWCARRSRAVGRPPSMTSPFFVEEHIGRLIPGRLVCLLCGLAMGAFAMAVYKQQPCYEARTQRDELAAQVKVLADENDSITAALLAGARHSGRVMGAVADSIASYQRRGRGITLVQWRRR